MTVHDGRLYVTGEKLMYLYLYLHYHCRAIHNESWLLLPQVISYTKVTS